MAVAEHTAEDCPAGLVRPNMDFIDNFIEQVERSGVTLVEAYIDAPSHDWFLLLDANDNQALNDALESFRRVGMVRVHPVLKLSDMTMWAKKIGIQR
jgi:uncharacterized protein DUF3303